MDMQSVAGLSAAIVAKAIEDWRLLIKSNAWCSDRQNVYFSFDEIRNFFRSKWCGLIFDGLHMATSPEEALAMLEAELDTAKRTCPPKKKKGRCGAIRVKALESGHVFDSITAAATFYGVCRSAITPVVDDAKHTAAGQHWVSL